MAYPRGAVTAASVPVTEASEATAGPASRSSEGSAASTMVAGSALGQAVKKRAKIKNKYFMEVK